MPKLLALFFLVLSIIFTSCRAQDATLSYFEFKNMIESKQVDQAVFYRNTNLVKIIHDGKERIYEYEMEINEGQEITRALTKAGIVYKTRNYSSE